ncbi:hypothetical protein ACU4GD_06090 [Cupriavidus basilensis]
METDLPRARAMIAEADTLAESLDLQTIELMWGHGLLARVDGDLASGHGQVARAVALARQRQDHWREYECLVWQATIAFELGRFDEVLGHSAEIEQAARRMRETGKAGQTTETVQAVDAMEAVEPAAPFAGALGALARLRLGQPAAQDELAASLASLRSVDDKAHLAYALNAAAAMALDRGQCEVAGTCASEALDAARAVRRLTEMTVAAACLVQAAASAGDAARAAGWLAELRWLVAGHQPSARGGGGAGARGAGMPCHSNACANARALGYLHALPHPDRRPAMSHIIVERSFATPQSDEDMKIVADRERPCLALYNVTPETQPDRGPTASAHGLASGQRLPMPETATQDPARSGSELRSRLGRRCHRGEASAIRRQAARQLSRLCSHRPAHLRQRLPGLHARWSQWRAAAHAARWA